MVDINSEEYLNKLNKACASKDGQIIIEFLKHESKRFEYENIKDNQIFEEIGMEFLVFKKIKGYFKDVLSRLDNAE